MRIDEITLDPTLSDGVKNLLAKGWAITGTGLFGKVLQKPGYSWVLKVYSTEDTAYTDFIEMVIANPNENFPKVIGNLVKPSRLYNAVRIERLETANTGSYDRFQAFSSYVEAYIHGVNFKPENDTSPYWLKILDARDWIEEFPSLQTACDLIGTRLLPHHSLDININNVMLRGRQYVLTDPVRLKNLPSTTR